MADNTIWLRAYVRAIAHDVDRLRNQIASLAHVLIGDDAKLREAYENHLSSLEKTSREESQDIYNTSLPEEDQGIKRLRAKFEKESE